MDARWSGEAKYQALLAVAQAANSRRDLSSVLEALCDALQGLVPTDLIGAVTHERDTVRARAIHFCSAPRRPLLGVRPTTLEARIRRLGIDKHAFRRRKPAP